MKFSFNKFSTTILIACCALDTTAQKKHSSANIFYTADTTDFPNPERGFYRYSATNVGKYVPLNVDELKNNRA